MNTYIVKFRWKNHDYEEIVHSNYDCVARTLIKNKYPNSSIKVVKKVNDKGNTKWEKM